MVDIRMSNGIHIQQRNLNHGGRGHLVEKLETLCWALRVWINSISWRTFMIWGTNTNECFRLSISSIVEHEYEVVRYKAADGSIIDGYFSCAGEAEIIDVESSELLEYFLDSTFCLPQRWLLYNWQLYCRTIHMPTGWWAQELFVLWQWQDGESIGSLPYDYIHLQDAGCFCIAIL